MVIVKIEGGLGNQMFQYALYLKLKSMGKSVKLDCSELDHYLEDHNWGAIFNIFKVKADFASKQELRQVKDMLDTIADRIQRRILGSKKSHYYEKESERGNFNKRILFMDNVYLDGYWQTYKYFDDIRNEVLAHYAFLLPMDCDNHEMLARINDSRCSVSLHMRLGDYLSEHNRTLYGDICTSGYYREAVEYFSSKFENPTFFVFSNDVITARKELRADSRYIFVDINDEKNAWRDMMLMSRCKHNIIANSSFSWWGAYLNNDQSKIVVAPRRWVNNREMSDICCKEWIRL